MWTASMCAVRRSAEAEGSDRAARVGCTGAPQHFVSLRERCKRRQPIQDSQSRQNLQILQKNRTNRTNR